MVFTTIESDLSKTGKSLAIFGKEWRNVVNDITNVKGIKNKFKATFSNSITNDDIVRLKEYNHLIEKGQNPQSAFYRTLRHSSAAAQDLAMNANGAAVSEEALAAATNRLTFAQKAAAVASKALGVALNMALNVGFVIAINAIISGIMYLVNRQKEAIEKARESAEAIKQETDAIDEYINKTIELRKKLDEENVSLEESKDIRSELRSIQDDLIDKYGEEARGIDLVTGSIENQTQALYNLNKAKYEDNYQLNKEGYDSARKQIQSSEIKIDASRILANGAGASTDKDVEKLRSLIISELNKKGYDFSYYDKAKYKELGDSKAINAMKKSADMYTIDEDLKKIYEKIENYSQNGSQAVKDAANASLTYISQIRRDWSNKTITDNEEMYAQWLKYDSSYSDDYINIIRKQANLEYAIESGNAEEITKAKDEFAELYRNTVDEAIKNGDTDVTKYLEKIFGDVADSSKNTSKSITTKYVPSVQKLTDAYKDLEEQIERILDLQNKLSDAFEKVASGEVFTAEEAYNLIKEIPELYNSITPVEGGFSFSLDGLESAYKAQNEELIKQIKENSKENQKVIDYYNEQKNKLDGLQSDTTASTGIRGFNALEADTKTSGYSENMTVLKQSADEASEIIKQNNALINILNGSLESHSMKLEGITTQYETARDKIDDYNSHVETIDKAISSLNENNALTYDEMAALVEISPALKSAFTEQGNGYYIAIDSLELLKEQSYTTRNSYIDDLIAMAEAEITSAEATKKALGDKINSWDSYISYTAEIAEVSAEIRGWQDLINKLTALKGKVYDTNSSSSSGEDTISNKLQQEIDYYEKIIQGIEAVADKRIEAINKEIEAINEQKDALKEQNDERQRELDLIEAQNNLDKAKKQKVFVYKEGQGLVQVQDEKAVKDAQKELDDAQREIKEAEYDKQIDLLEQQSKATEEYRDTFSDMKSDIEDAIAVEQAKSALGTDEKGLLGLDNSAINGIQNGLAKAVVEKENEDNKDNPHYKDVTWADLMKKLGSNATMEEFKAKVYDPMMSSFSPEKLYNIQGGSNNQYITNNSPATFTATFNISGATDPNEVAKVVRTEITDLLQRTYNKIK